MKRRLLITLTLQFLFLTSYGQSFDDLDFLAGTWKVEGKETYEAWEKTGNGFNGSSYKIKDGKKIVTETLSIKIVHGKIVYEAKVVNQNEGKGIPFTLNADTAQSYSFENPTHDFPTKIIYQKASDKEMIVQVLGADNKGFTLKFTKQ